MDGAFELKPAWRPSNDEKKSKGNGRDVTMADAA